MAWDIPPVVDNAWIRSTVWREIFHPLWNVHAWIRITVISTNNLGSAGLVYHCMSLLPRVCIVANSRSQFLCFSQGCKGNKGTVWFRFFQKHQILPRGRQYHRVYIFAGRQDGRSKSKMAAIQLAVIHRYKTLRASLMNDTPLGFSWSLNSIKMLF